jgi:hypothetical protein
MILTYIWNRLEVYNALKIIFGTPANVFGGHRPLKPRYVAPLFDLGVSPFMLLI